MHPAIRFLPVAALFASAIVAHAGTAHAGSVRADKAIGPNTPGWEEVGEATWYGGYHQGRRTSSGAIFDQNAMTAAHATLPLGTRVRVTVQETGASVIVTITDRQPAKTMRVIDLARGAAARVGIVSKGAAMVTISAPGNDAPEEVAEAPDDQPISGAGPRRHGPRHTHRAARAA